MTFQDSLPGKLEVYQQKGVITMDNREILQETCDTIDAVFGKEYARKNPRLVAALFPEIRDSLLETESEEFK